MYYVIIIILIIMMLFYGGHQHIKKIEYDSKYFINYHKILLFENKLLNIYNKNILNENNFMSLDKNIYSSLVPNLENVFIIKIKSLSEFNIKLLNDSDKFIMVLLNSNNIPIYIKITNNDDDNNFYKLDKKIHIIDLKNIYNNSNKDIVIFVFICKKPFWHY